MPRTPLTRCRLPLLMLCIVVLAGCGAESLGSGVTDQSSPVASLTIVPTGTPAQAPATATPRIATPEPMASPLPATPPSPASTPWVVDVPQASPIVTIPDTPEQHAATGLVAGEPGVYGFVVLEADGTVVASLNGTTPFITASLYKLILMADILWRAESGMFTLDDTLVLDAELFGDYGDMYFAEEEIGSAFTIEEYLYAMGAYSSNAAARTLLTLTSTEVLRMTARVIGMEQTWLFAEPEELPSWPPTPAVDAPPDEVDLARSYLEESFLEEPVSITTPLDMARYQLALLNGTLISPWVSEQVAAILEEQMIRDRIPYYLEEDFRVLNKPGNLEDSVNDVGVVYLPSGPRAIAMLAMAVPDTGRATLVEQRLALIATGDTEIPPMPW